MNILIEILVGIIIGAGCFIGGIHYERSSPPKVIEKNSWNYVYTTQDVEAKQISIQSMDSSTYVINTERTQFRVIVQDKRTNYSFNNFTNRNRFKTNYIIKSNRTGTNR